MLRIKLELLPLGDEDQAKELGEIKIWNDTTGNEMYGNYGYSIIEKRSDFADGITQRGTIKNHSRQNTTCKLLFKVLQDVFDRGY